MEKHAVIAVSKQPKRMLGNYASAAVSQSVSE